MNKYLIIAVTALALASCSTGKTIDTVSVEGGLIQGVLTENPDVMVFKGVPYAAAPVGDLRWALPQPVIPWEGVKVADTFGSPAIQPGRAPGSFYYKEFQPEPLLPQSEDCLFLNIWTPADAVGHPETGLPVAMWIHGGAYYNGCGSDVAFDRKLPGDDAGAFHSAELWYMFNTLGRSWRPMEEHDFELSEEMMDYWTNFAKYGNPNGKDVEGEWKPYTRLDPYVELLK